MSVDPRRGTGSNKRPLLERDILAAQQATRSAKEAAQYLHVDYTTYKKYAKMYGIFEQHKGRGGRRGGSVSIHGMHGLEEIFAGKYPNYDRKKLKERLFKSGLIPQECHYCGFNETRITDGRSPLLLDYRDGDKNNLARENLCAICYNCAYLTTGKVSPAMASQALHDADLIANFNATDEDFEAIRSEILAEIHENPEKS